MEYSPAINRRNIALVLLCTVTLSALRPRINLAQRASSFQYSLVPASNPLNGPARKWIVERHHAFIFRIDHILPALRQLFGFKLFRVVGIRYDLQTHRRQCRVVQQQRAGLHGVIRLYCPAARSTTGAPSLRITSVLF